MYPTKYFGCELGAQTQFDAKNERYIVNGSHDSSKLQDLLDGFIKRFVLCPECENPETKLAVATKKGTIGQRCIACGHSNQVDLRHKVTTYIIKNPPVEESGSSAATPGKKTKRDKKAGSSTNGDVSPEVGNGDSNNMPPMRSVSGGAVNEEEEDDDWGEDVSEAAVEARRIQELSGAVSSMVVTEDLQKTPSERVNIFYAFIKKRKEQNKVCGIENEKEIVGEAERLDIRDKATVVLAEVLLDAGILSQIKAYRNLFCRFTNENPKAQKYLLGGLEMLVGDVHKAELLNKGKALVVLKQFYDLDILEEDALLDWANKGPSKKHVKKEVSKQIHENVSPFINWLKEAEEEDSSEEEEDVEVVYSHTGKVGTETITTKPADKPADEDEDDDDDDDEVDIDNI